ncbi:hypothetical protein PCE1_004356 [Barthelona sp. PCE]
MADVDEVDFPDNVILPPPRVLQLIHRIVQSVLASGKEFEQLVKEKYGGRADFAFLDEDNPYHTYYKYKLSESVESKISPVQDEPEEVQEAELVDSTEESSTTVAIQQAARLVINTEFPKPENIPLDLDFVIGSCPSDAKTRLLIDVTAQHVARAGKTKLADITMKYSNDTEFSFLSANDPHYLYFMSLIKSYAIIYHHPQRIHQYLDERSNKTEFLERAYERKGYALHQESEFSKNIDWEDFELVATVDFTDKRTEIIETKKEEKEEVGGIETQNWLDLLNTQHNQDDKKNFQASLGNKKETTARIIFPQHRTKPEWDLNGQEQTITVDCNISQLEFKDAMD